MSPRPATAAASLRKRKDGCALMCLFMRGHALLTPERRKEGKKEGSVWDEKKHPTSSRPH